MTRFRRLLSLATAIALLAGCLSVGVYADEDEEIMQGVGYVITNRLRLYEKKDTDSDVLDNAWGGDRVVVISRGKTWSKVLYNLEEGYMLTSCLDIDEEEDVELGNGIINEDIVYLRSGPGTEYSILSSGFKNHDYEVIGLYDGWYKLIKDNETCYVRSDLMDLTEIPYENEDSETEPRFYLRGEPIGDLTFEECEAVQMAEDGGYYAPVSGGTLLQNAKKYIGTPYVFGGASPEGFDCSGLIYYCLTQMGKSSYRTAADQYKMGTKVSRKNLRSGDLVFFENTYTSGISHVGIYAGDGKFLHAPGDGGAVRYDKLSGYWSDHYYGARRIG